MFDTLALCTDGKDEGTGGGGGFIGGLETYVHMTAIVAPLE